MIPFIYPYKRKENDFILLESVRLVRELYPNAPIFTVGDSVEGIDNIPFKDSYQIRGCNVTAKCLYVADLFKDFVYMNDDFIINDRYDLSKVYGGNEELERKEGKASIAWQQAVDNTKHFLKHNGFNTLTYECHQPVVFNSELLVHTMDLIEWKNNNHFIKSLYFNINEPTKVIPMENTKLKEFKEHKANTLLNIYGCLSVSHTFLANGGAEYLKGLSNT